MPTIQQQLNQLKRDKETLNTMLNTMGVETTGNETFTQLTPLVGKIVTDPILQDKSITITENGTQTITADEGYDGLNSVEVVTNVASSGGEEEPIEPDYITDGLVSWWESEDGFDTSAKWHSRVGTDYITPAAYGYGNATTNPPIIIDKAVYNNGIWGFVTQQDYCLQDYTIQVVGYLDGVANSSGNAMNILIGCNMGASPMIGVSGNGNAMFVNGSNITHEKIYSNMTKKIFNASLNFVTPPKRNVNSVTTLSYSINGGSWYTASNKSENHSSKGNNLTILCYYTASYRSLGAKIYSIRIYNRKLTTEELQKNYEIDKARFKIDNYTE